MNLPPLHQAVLLRRYKRFLADVILPTGETVTAHCPNPGRMTTCWTPGATCLLSHHATKRRKLAWTLEYVSMDDGWVLVNTARPNQFVGQALRAHEIPDLQGYTSINAEVPHGDSRVDFVLSSANLPTCWIEVKCVTLLHGDRLQFPDAVSKRATKHLHTLMDCVRAGDRAVLFFLAGRPGGSSIGPADHIDPTYGTTLREAAQLGVELLAYRATFAEGRARIAERIESIDLRSISTERNT